MPTTTARNFDAVRVPLTAIVDATPDDAWDNASPCEGWTARDVVGHLIDSQRDFFDRQAIALPAAPESDPVAAWHDHAAAVAHLLADQEIVDQAYDGHFGPTTIGETIETFFITDLIAHRWDLARAVGADDTITDEELDVLDAGFAVYGPTAYMPGVFSEALDVDDDADRQTKVLARMGRHA